PEGWLDTHGYADVSAEALATCGVGGGGAGGGASASASASAAVAPPISAGATAQLDYIVYNNYYEDNSITNNIENHGDLDFNQQIGDGNVNIGDVEGDFDGNVQTGDGVLIDDSVVQDSNIETGEGDQLVDESVNTNVVTSVGGDAQAANAGGDVTQTIEEAPPEEAPPEEPADPIL
ncbi:MAG: hypothetical protein ACRDY6_11920, partial [Acidimicrobiia bacterium]